MEKNNFTLEFVTLLHSIELPLQSNSSSLIPVNN